MTIPLPDFGVLFSAAAVGFSMVVFVALLKKARLFLSIGSDFVSNLRDPHLYSKRYRGDMYNKYH